MQNRLPLPRATFHVTPLAVLLHLGDVSLDRLPTIDLPLIVLPASAHVVTTVPLEPATRVVFMEPALFLPNR